MERFKIDETVVLLEDVKIKLLAEPNANGLVKCEFRLDNISQEILIHERLINAKKTRNISFGW